MKRKLRFKFKISENDIKLQCKQYLSLKGWFHFPILQGLGAFKGIADRIAIKDGRTIYLEIKKPGGILSPDQRDFKRNIIYQKGEYYLIDNLDDLIRIIDQIDNK